MRVLLVQPPSQSEISDRIFLHEPLALEYLGAGLKLDGHEVRLLDTRLEPDMSAAFSQFRPDLVGLTGYTSQVTIIKEVARRLKAISPDVAVVVGGHHATVRPIDFNVPEIDLVVIGEGVTTLREIVGQWAGRRQFHGIKGLAIPGREMAFTEPRPYPGLDSLPLPDRSLTAPYRKEYFNEWLRPLASIRTSLGCTARCNFCALWAITGGKYLRRNPEAVVAELREIKEKNVFFCDDESMCDIRRMDQLADLIREAGLRKNYFLYARADTIVKRPELFRKWRDIGLQQVFVGMETFSDERLQDLKKGLTVDDGARAVQVLKSLGILMYANFMVDPAFTRDDFRLLVDYVRKLKLSYASFSILTPLPGTQLFAEREKDLLSYRPEHFDFVHTVLPTTLPLPEFYDECANLYQSAIPFRYAIRTLANYGLRRIPEQLRLFKAVLRQIREEYPYH